MEYDKLIRDKVPDLIRESGKECVTISPKDKLIQTYYFQLKIQEELEELVHARDDEKRIEEFADLIEVVYALRSHLNIPYDKVEKARYLKNKKNGTFNKKLVLKEVR